MEAEIQKYEQKEEFASYQINCPINSDFGKKSQKSHALTSTSITRPPLVVNPSASVPFVSSSPTPGQSTTIPVNPPIYSM